MTSNRGVIQIWLVVSLTVAALGAAGVAVKKGFGIFGSEDTAKAKAESVQLVQANERVRAAEEEAAKLRAQADAAAAQLAAQQQKRRDAVTEDVSGVVYALEQESDPSLNVQAGLAFARSAYRNSDPISEARLQAMREQVKQLTAQNAEIRKSAFAALGAKDAALDQERAKEAAMEANVRAIAAEKFAAETNADTIGQKFDAEVKAHAATLAQVTTLGQKIASFGRWALVSAGLILALLWVLPVIARAFPEARWLSWIAIKGGALLAGGLHALHRGEQKLKDQGIRKVGEALAAVRAEAPEAASRVVDIFDRNITDPRLQKMIAAAAEAVTGPARG